MWELNVCCSSYAQLGLPHQKTSLSSAKMEAGLIQKLESQLRGCLFCGPCLLWLVIDRFLFGYAHVRECLLDQRWRFEVLTITGTSTPLSEMSFWPRESNRTFLGSGLISISTFESGWANDKIQERRAHRRTLSGAEVEPSGMRTLWHSSHEESSVSDSIVLCRCTSDFYVYVT